MAVLHCNKTSNSKASKSAKYSKRVLQDGMIYITTEIVM